MTNNVCYIVRSEDGVTVHTHPPVFTTPSFEAELALCRRYFMEEKIAEPTVGRIVYFYDGGTTIPVPAMVQAVVPGSLLITTLIVFRHDGIEAVEATRHKSETHHRADAHWDWMPYQKGQAAKTEALQEQLDKSALKMGQQSIDDRELSKNQASAPSPVDGKR